MCGCDTKDRVLLDMINFAYNAYPKQAVTSEEYAMMTEYDFCFHSGKSISIQYTHLHMVPKNLA